MRRLRRVHAFTLTVCLSIAAGCRKDPEAQRPPPKPVARKTTASLPRLTQHPARTKPAFGPKLPPDFKPSAPVEVPVPPDVAAPSSGARRTSSGLAFKVLRPGTGPRRPGHEDLVRVQRLQNTVGREPLQFPVAGVMKGWSEGVQLMVEGEKRRFWIPPALASDAAVPPGDVPAGGLVVYDIELVAIVERPRPPEDVAAPPPGATRTSSGLAYRVLEPGTGKERPKAGSHVEVQYSAWTTEGKLVDSSVIRGRSRTFALAQVVPGWAEAVQLMTVGEKARFWIPPQLAVNDRGRAGRTAGRGPRGTLVFDIELVAIR
jgi:FKBP-type peptidyl-prolyl cis-trans isomerase